MNSRIINGRILLDGDIRPSELHFSNELICDPSTDVTEKIDAQDCLVLPGIVDIHGDGFERQIMPRPKVHFPLDVALMETDTQMLGSGITTCYHGVTVSWEPGLRNIETSRDFVQAVKRLSAQLGCDTKLHIRWETFALDAVDEIMTWLGDLDDAIFAINDHTTSMMQGGIQARKVDTMAARSGMTRDEFDELSKTIWARRDEVPHAIETASRQALENGAILFAHDEVSPEMRQRFRELGAVVSEFPMNEETAKSARDAGEHTILGAPNVVRGGSHNGALNAAPAVVGDLCSVLTSDYYYPAVLLAPFLLAAEHGVPLADAWHLVSKNAAEAVQLRDRGTLDVGKRADFVLVDDSVPTRPRVMASYVAGKKVFDRRAA